MDLYDTSIAILLELKMGLEVSTSIHVLIGKPFLLELLRVAFAHILK